jgi:hypothetical protein
VTHVCPPLVGLGVPRTCRPSAVGGVRREEWYAGSVAAASASCKAQEGVPWGAGHGCRVWHPLVLQLSRCLLSPLHRYHDLLVERRNRIFKSPQLDKLQEFHSLSKLVKVRVDRPAHTQTFKSYLGHLLSQLRMFLSSMQQPVNPSEYPEMLCMPSCALHGQMCCPGHALLRGDHIVGHGLNCRFDCLWWSTGTCAEQYPILSRHAWHVLFRRPK